MLRDEVRIFVLQFAKNLKSYRKSLKIIINFKRGPCERKKYEIKYFNLKVINFTQNQSNNLLTNLRTRYMINIRQT